MKLVEKKYSLFEVMQIFDSQEDTLLHFWDMFPDAEKVDVIVNTSRSDRCIDLSIDLKFDFMRITERGLRYFTACGVKTHVWLDTDEVDYVFYVYKYE